MEYKEQKKEGIIDKEIEIDNRKIVYTLAGDPRNPSIIFLHGMPGNIEMKERVVNELSNEYFVIAPDHPGLSRSEPLMNYTNIFEQYADVVFEILKSENMDDKDHIVMGQSFGGIIASVFSEKYKKNTNTLLLTDAQMGYQRNDLIRKILFNFGSVIIRAYFYSPNFIRKQGLRIFFGATGFKRSKKQLIGDRITMIDNLCFLLRNTINNKINLLDRDYNKNLPIILLWGDRDGNEFNLNGYSKSNDAHKLYLKFKNENRNVKFKTVKGGHTILYDKTKEVVTEIKGLI